MKAEVVRGKGALNPITLPLEGKILTFTQADKFELLEKGYKVKFPTFLYHIKLKFETFYLINFKATRSFYS